MSGKVVGLFLVAAFISATAAKSIEIPSSLYDSEIIQGNNDQLEAFQEMMEFWNFMANNDRTLLKQKSKKDGPMEDKKQSQPLDYPASPIGLTLLGSVKPVNQRKARQWRPLDDFFETDFRYLNKKSHMDSKFLRFHTCFFNPVSCF